VEYFQFKILSQHFSAEVHLTHLIVIWRRANKTTLPPLIRLQNRVVRAFSYDKTQTDILQALSFLNHRFYYE